MAAVTVVSQNVRHVTGDLRLIVAKVTVANSGDTWAVPGIHQIISAVATPNTARSNGITFTGSTITFLSSAGDESVVVFGM